jgi:hypothetical protein
MAGARVSDTLGVCFHKGPHAKGDRGDAFLAHMKRRVSRAAAAARAMELRPRANPARVGRWLETKWPHISPVVSPLTERGPPRR